VTIAWSPTNVFDRSNKKGRGWSRFKELGAAGYDPFGPEGANYNLLIGGSALDPISGTPSDRSYLCEIRLAN